jgi:hypothetical protein
MTAVPAGTASGSISGTGAQAPARPAVPWRTVIPLAAMMAYADGFWMVSLRGAVGAIERTQEPFLSWLRESTVLLPAFVLAVIAAVTLALRWFGPVLAGKKAFFMTALLIAAAGTVAGTVILAASEAWDYALQHDLMSTLHHATSAQSVDQLDQSSLGLQLAAFGYGVGLLLVTNLVVTGWTVAIRGGRLDVSRQQKATPERTPRRVPAGRCPDGRHGPQADAGSGGTVRLRRHPSRRHTRPPQSLGGRQRLLPCPGDGGDSLRRPAAGTGGAERPLCHRGRRRGSAGTVGLVPHVRAAVRAQFQRARACGPG